jgi:hypothetical protein
MVAWDESSQTLYVYDGTKTVGNRWIEVPLDEVTDTDNRLDNPTVTLGNLTFDILNVITGIPSGTVSVPIADIAPVQNVVGGSGISVTQSGNTFTVINDSPSNPTDELQTLSTTFPSGGGSINLSDGGGSAVIVPGTGITVDDNGLGNIRITNAAPDQTVSLTQGTGITVTGTYPNFTVTNSGDLSDTNEAQTLSSSFPSATTAQLTLSAVSAVGGGTITFIQGSGIDISNNSGNIEITSEDHATGPYDDHVAAGNGGVPLGGYFYTSATNTMGVPAGTKVRRSF